VSQRTNIDRRQFLKRTSAAAAGAAVFPYIVPGSALGQGASVAPSERIVHGAIGVGSRGSGVMRGFLGNKEVQVVAVCDVDRSRRESAKKRVDDTYGNSDCRMYHDFREVIARDDIDTLSLALPDHWHSIPVIMAAQAGKDMYAEKPLARTIHEGRQMANAVHRYNRVWQTGSQQRSTANFHKACELVINGRIGKVHKVEVGLPTGRSGPPAEVKPVPEGLDWDFWLGPAPWRPYMEFGNRGVHWDWRWVRDYSGGQLTDWAGHHIDIAHWGLGLGRTGPVEIEGRGDFPEDGVYNVAMTYKFRCRYANGVEMTVANNRQVPQGTKWYGDKGWIYVKRGKLQAEPADVLDETIGPNETHLYESRNHVGNFLECVRTREETVAPIEIGHRSISVGLLGEIAMLSEQRLQWDPDHERFLNSDEANALLRRSMRAPWRLSM
jgi:predicted dehydrogenase